MHNLYLVKNNKGCQNPLASIDCLCQAQEVHDHSLQSVGKSIVL